MNNSFDVNPLVAFWKGHPALFVGFSLFLGFCFTFNDWRVVFIPLLFFWAPFLIHFYFKRALTALHMISLSLSLMIAASIYGTWHYQIPDLPFEGVRGVAYLDIESLRVRSSPFSQNWVYGCELKAFVPDGSLLPIARHVKCSTSLPKKREISRPLANGSYFVKGILKVGEKGNCFLRVKNKERWQPVAKSWSAAEWRYRAKQAVKESIHRHISQPKSRVFLAGLATGEFDDRELAADFGRFGLQHIMAISGFHFAIIAAILSFFLRFFFSPKISAIVIVALLSIYFLFLGTTASILRSWTMISIAMAGFYLEKSPNALNSLGVAMIIALLIDPLFSQTLGFQLSFLTTAAILLLFSTLDYGLTFLLTKRSLSQMVEMNRLNQHAYLILCFFRQGIALTLAVNIFAVPALLYYFNQFPVMSLLYNLFFPFLVTGSMLLLILGIFIPGINRLNSVYTNWVLDYTRYMPSSVDVYLQVDNVPASAVVLYLSIAATVSIILKEKLQEQGREAQDFAFL